MRRTVALGEGRLDLGNDILLSEQMFFWNVTQCCRRMLRANPEKRLQKKPEGGR